MTESHFNMVVVGTGFASTFFLHEYLRHAKPSDKVLVLERGRDLSYNWKLEHKANTDISSESTYRNATPKKGWVQTMAFGGGACWEGNTPRFHPSDFRLRTLHGIGDDWPFGYEELEPYFCEVEELMGVAGVASSAYPRSRPYPSPPHALNAFDRALQAHFPDQYIAMPSARASVPRPGRPACCNNGVCSICPIQAKFQVDLHMRHVYADPRVTLRTEAEVVRLDVQGGVARAVVFMEGRIERRAVADLVAVGAHAIMTPYLLLRSGLDDAALGRYLNEQVGVPVRIHLRGLKNFGGGQRISGLGTMFVDHGDRGRTPGCLVEGFNVPWLRAEFGRWREVAFIKFVFEDIPSEKNYVKVGTDGRPEVHYAEHSDYVLKGIASVGDRVNELLAALPVDEYSIEIDSSKLDSEAHIQGTTRMGLDPATSVVDPQQVHHRVRNLVVLGSSVFPTCPAANPTMPLSALSVRAARKLFAQ